VCGEVNLTWPYLPRQAAAPEEAAAEALGRCDALESALKSTLRVYEAAVRRSEEAAEAAEAAREAFGVAAAEEEAAEAAVCEALAGLEPQGMSRREGRSD